MISIHFFGEKKLEQYYVLTTLDLSWILHSLAQASRSGFGSLYLGLVGVCLYGLGSCGG